MKIKFRAWWHDIKRWEYGLFVNESGELFEDDYGTNKVSHRGTYSVQQWTGLLDKTGKEIFEGDLVRIKTPLQPDGKILEVKWLDFGAWNIAAGMSEWLGLKVEYEILGNIYENLGSN